MGVRLVSGNGFPAWETPAKSRSVKKTEQPKKASPAMKQGTSQGARQNTNQSTNRDAGRSISQSVGRSGNQSGGQGASHGGSQGASRPASTKKPEVDLYIIHGWTYTVEPWKTTLGILEKNGIKVKMLKVPGLTEKSDKVFTIDDYVKWADQEIPDGAVALGHSNGGRILLNLSAKRPDKLKYLVLMDAAGIYEPSAKKQIVEKVAKIGRPLKKISAVSKVFHRITGTTDYSHAPENMKQTLVNMLESDKNLDLGKVTTSTYILWGKKDTTTPPRQATIMYERLPHAELKFYAKWTHAPYISDPEGLAKALTALMGRLKK